MTFGQPCVSVCMSAIVGLRTMEAGCARTFVCWAVRGIVAALDARTRASRFHELDVMLVAQALAPLRVAASACSATGVVLASVVVRVEPAQVARSDAAGD